MENKDEAYLEIEPELFESIKKKSQEDFKRENPNDDNESYWFPDLEFDCIEDEWKDGVLTLSGSMEKSGKRLGYVSIKMKMDTERILEIISDYMKRLGKVKTVLEATKD